MSLPASVSVVVPVLDDADQLERCLAALAAQTRPADEVLVVDNGSSDRSVAVALAAGASVLHEPVRAIGAAAAHGYDAAVGDVIARIDSDTVVPVDWLDRTARWFADPTVAAVTGAGDFRDLGPVADWFWRTAYMRAYFGLMTGALARPPLFGSNMAFRRDAWLAVRSRVHRDDPLVHDDVDLALQFDPAWRTVLDRSLVVSVSSDAVHHPVGLLVRTRKAYRTIRLAGLRGLPPARIMRRFVAGDRVVPPARGGRSASEDAPRPVTEPVVVADA